MTVWSWRRHRLAKNCDLSNWLTYVGKVPKEVPEFVHAGRKNHELIEHFVRNLYEMEGKLGEVEPALTNALKGGYGADKKLEERLPWIADQCPESGLGYTHMIEEKVSLPDGSAVGIIDLAVKAKDHLVMVDWKTGWGNDPQDLDQCRWYAYLLLRQEPNWHPSVIELRVVRPLRGITDHALENWLTINEFGAEMEGKMAEKRHLDDLANAPAGNLTDKCATCWVRRSCPDFQYFLDSDPATPRDAWAMREGLKAKLAQVEAFIKEALHDHGPFDIPDGRVELHAVDSWKYPALDVWGLLKAQGMDSEEFLATLSISGSAMKKLVIDEDDMASVQAACGKRSVSHRLKKFKD